MEEYSAEDFTLALADDPVGQTYRFGDRFTIQSVNCNILEFDVTVNRRRWTWTVEK